MSDILNRIDLRFDLVERHLARHVITESGCWTFTGCVHPSGYGHINLYVKELTPKKRKYRAHRLAYAYYHGIDPGERFVCHHCDNPLCINPDHLFLGTPADNSADMVAKGRSLRQSGSRNHASKLTEPLVLDVVAKIRQGMNNKQIAEALPVSHSSVSLIRLGKIWQETLEAANYDPDKHRVFKRRRSA